jgi:outer membrane protein assembly factor BamD (BamD/ComL family)
MQDRVSRAQEASEVNRQFESDWEMLYRVEADVELLTSEAGVQLLVPNVSVRNRTTMAIKAEQELKKILQLYPQTPLRDRVDDNLFQVQEFLGLHSLKIAQFYFDKGHGMKGAESRLQHIIQQYPKFSRMDEALLLLGKAYLMDGQPEAAADYFWKLVCKYPSSRYAAKAFEQLNHIGFDASKGCDNLVP